MTAWDAITNAEIIQDKPVTQTLMTKMRDNPIAIAEGASGAPIVATGWHPYDMVDVGDGADGKIYDYSVDGGVTTLVTPDFADGYEYAFNFVGMSVASSNLQLFVEGYMETSAAYDTAHAITSTVAAANTLDILLEFPSVRRSLYRHVFIHKHSTVYTGAALASVTLGAVQYVSDLTRQKLTRLRFGFAQTTDAGQVFMYRRRNYTTD